MILIANKSRHTYVQLKYRYKRLYILPGVGVLHQIFGTRVQHTKKKWTQCDLSFCKIKGFKNLKLMEKVVNWIENEGKIDTKCLKSVK